MKDNFLRQAGNQLTCCSGEVRSLLRQPVCRKIYFQLSKWNKQWSRYSFMDDFHHERSERGIFRGTSDLTADLQERLCAGDQIWVWTCSWFLLTSPLRVISQLIQHLSAECAPRCPLLPCGSSSFYCSPHNHGSGTDATVPCRVARNGLWSLI